MPVHLLDVNVLIALAWPQHVHHERVRQWFAAHAAEGWATCPITQCGFVRISSNPKIMGAAATPAQAVAALRQLMTHPNHDFWPDDLPFTDQQWIRHDSRSLRRA